MLVEDTYDHRPCLQVRDCYVHLMVALNRCEWLGTAPVRIGREEEHLLHGGQFSNRQ